MKTETFSAPLDLQQALARLGLSVSLAVTRTDGNEMSEADAVAAQAALARFEADVFHALRPDAAPQASASRRPEPERPRKRGRGPAF